MTIQIENGWLQYDNQIGTFRGERNGVIYGTYTNEFETAEELVSAIDVTLSQNEISDLEHEKETV